MSVDVNAYPVELSATSGAATLALSLVVAAASLSPTAGEVTLSASGYSYSLPVTAASLTPSCKVVPASLTRKNTALALTLTAQSVALTEGFGSGTSYTLPVDSATPTIAAQTVEFSEVREFVSAALSLTPQTVNLNAPVTLPVTTASLTPSPKAVTLTPALRVTYRGITATGQVVTFPRTFVVGSRSLAAGVGDVALLAGSNYRLTVESVAFNIDAQPVTLTLSQPSLPVTAASISLSPKTATFRWAETVTAASLTPTSYAPGLNVKTGVTRAAISPTVQAVRLGAGLTVTAAGPSMAGKDVTLTRSIPGYLPVDSVSLSLATQVIGLSQSASLGITDIRFREIPLVVSFKQRSLNVEFYETPARRINFKASA